MVIAHVIVDVRTCQAEGVSETPVMKGVVVQRIGDRLLGGGNP